MKLGEKLGVRCVSVVSVRAKPLRFGRNSNYEYDKPQKRNANSLKKVFLKSKVASATKSGG